MRHHAHPYQMCGSLCAKSNLHQGYTYYGYDGLMGGRCMCFDSLPSASNLVEDAECLQNKCTEHDHSSEECVESTSPSIRYWAAISANQPNLAVSLKRSTFSVEPKIYRRGTIRSRLLKSIIARDVSDPLNQAMGEPDQITTDPSESFNPSPNSIFSGQTSSQTSPTDPVPIVAVAMACISLGLGVFCLLVALYRLNQLRHRQKQKDNPILPEINLSSECTDKLREQELLQKELSVDNQSFSSSHRLVHPLIPSQHYRQPNRAGFSSTGDEKSGGGTLKDGVRIGKATYKTQPLDKFSNEMDTKQVIGNLSLSHGVKGFHLSKRPLEIEADHPKPLKNHRISEIQSSHAYGHPTLTYNSLGSKANREHKSPPKLDVPSSLTNPHLISKPSDFLNPTNVCGTGSVVSPEKLARESYPHPNIVPSGTKVPSITPITRNSWMIKHPQSLKLKESMSNCSLNSSSEPQPVRKLKASFGVGLETDRLDVTPEVPNEVDESDHQETDFFNPGSSLSRNRSYVSKPDVIEPAIPASSRANRLDLDLDEYKRFSSSTKLETLDSQPIALHRTRSDSNSNNLSFPSRGIVQSNETHFLNQGTSYPSLGLPKLSNNELNSHHYPPVKPTPKMNGLLNFGNMLSNFTRSPSSKSKIDNSNETHSEEDLKHSSTYASPKSNWSRRRKIISGNWKRINAARTPTRSLLSGSISSDALSQGYMKNDSQTHSDLNHSLNVYDDSSYELKQERLRNRHKYSKSVPDMSFLTQLHSDDETEFEPKQLNIMNPDQPSLSESARSASPCELQQKRRLSSPTKFRFDHQFFGRHRDSEDHSTLSSSSDETSTAIQKPPQFKPMKEGKEDLIGFVNHLGYEEFKSQLGILDHKVRSSEFRKSDPILYGRWSKAIEIYRKKESISSKSCGNLLSKSLIQTSEKRLDSKSRKPTLEIQTGFLKNESLDDPEDHVSPLKDQTFRHPIYNLPMSSRLDHSNSIEKREQSIDLILNQNNSPIICNQDSSQESYSSAQPGTSKSISPIQATNPTTPISSTKPVLVKSDHHHHQEDQEDESIPFFSRPRSSTSILRLTDRHLSLGGISAHSSEDLSSFCTGAASLNSEPQWKSRLNSVGSFATNQSFEEQQKLWVANPDRFYSPSLESILHPSPRLNLSPVPTPTRASGSVNC
ncbi:hypothetical protein DFH28DRAFT_879254 [Melampsora americana]|nr:hypothetical protein DFH28DRAFT_879254 [Melampsora americana]